MPVECVTEGCHNLAAIHSRHCLVHQCRFPRTGPLCSESGCREQADLFSRYCLAHKPRMQPQPWEATHDRVRDDEQDSVRELAAATEELRRICDRLDETNRRLASLVTELRSHRREG